MGMGNLYKECKTAFSCSATIVAEKVTHTDFELYSFKLQYIIPENV